MKSLFKREKYLSKIRGIYHETDLIKVITGIRGSGKTTLMFSIAEELKAIGVDDEQICFINLDKRGYKFIKTSAELETLIDKSFSTSKTKYLFIDEIQNVDDFETVLEAFRLEGDYSIFITGSNSYLLSGELVTKITGRYLEFEMFPLSFDEYLEMKKFFGKTINSNLTIELDNYILEGGFPRTILIDSLSEKRKYVSGVVDEIFQKDIYGRIKVKNRDTFNIIMNYIINNYGLTTSVNSIAKELLKAGYSIKNETISKYIQALINAKILYQCDRFDMRSKKMLKGEKKYYLADLSLSFITNPDSRINYGQVLENIVYIYAKSQDYSISVGRIGKLECDFILKDKFLNYSYIQVAYTIMNDIKTENREYVPLELIRDNYPKYVITTDYLLQKRNGIIHVNLMEHLKEHKLF